MPVLKLFSFIARSLRSFIWIPWVPGTRLRLMLWFWLLGLGSLKQRAAQMWNVDDRLTRGIVMHSNLQQQRHPTTLLDLSSTHKHPEVEESQHGPAFCPLIPTNSNVKLGSYRIGYSGFLNYLVLAHRHSGNDAILRHPFLS